jgi:hypothetical protein
MKTANLISALVADLAISSMRLQRTFALALVMGSVLAAATFFLWIGFRPDIAQALETVRFPFKLVVTLSLAATATGFLVRLRAAGCFARSLAPRVAGGAPAVGVCGGNRIGGYARRHVVAAAHWLECPRLPDADPPSVDWAARMHLACLAARGAYPARPRWCCCRARRERYRGDALCLELH